jgi:hypothetical protein
MVEYSISLEGLKETRILFSQDNTVENRPRNFANIN